MKKYEIHELGYTASVVFDTRKEAEKFLSSLNNCKNRKINKKLWEIREVEQNVKQEQ